MTTIIHHIDSYQLRYFGKRSNNSQPIAYISFWNDDNKYIGTAYFYRDGQEIPNNSSYEKTSPMRTYLRMHERQIDSVVDMLRNEKPCKAYYNSPTFALIYTGREPVGEEEFEV